MGTVVSFAKAKEAREQTLARQKQILDAILRPSEKPQYAVLLYESFSAASAWDIAESDQMPLGRGK
jgi:hypothetical protein